MSDTQTILDLRKRIAELEAENFRLRQDHNAILRPIAERLGCIEYQMSRTITATIPPGTIQ